MPRIIKIFIMILALATVGIYISSIPQLKSKLLPSKKTAEEIKVETPSTQIADTYLEITESGSVIKGQNDSLPQLYLPGELKLSEGQKIEDKNILFAARISSLVPKTDFHASSIRILAKNEVALYQTDQTVAIFSSEKSPDEQVDSLQQVLAAAKIEGTKLAKIDLRFDKPTVTFK